MADQQPQYHESEAATKVGVETTDGGMFDFLKKKDEEKHVEEEKPTLMGKLHHSDSNSSSSSDEGEDGEKKKKKKGLKEKIKEKMSVEKEADTEHKETSVPVERCDEIGNAETIHPEEKKGFLEKIKEKLPGHHNKAEEGASAECAADKDSPEGEPKEKKGILEKIKDKLPGCHKNEEEEKGKREKEN